MLNILLFLMYTIFSPLTKSSKREPARLDKKEGSSFENFCRKACPYVLFTCMIILCVLLFIALVRYGHAFSTEANNFYNGELA